MVDIFKLVADNLDYIPPNVSPANLPQSTANAAKIQDILTIVLTIIGGAALLVLVLSGLRYITSSGNPERTSKAKNGVIYALVGIVLAVTAQAIVAFVLNRL